MSVLLLHSIPYAIPDRILAPSWPNLYLLIGGKSCKVFLLQRTPDGYPAQVHPVWSPLIRLYDIGCVAVYVTIGIKSKIF